MTYIHDAKEALNFLNDEIERMLDEIHCLENKVTNLENKLELKDIEIDQVTTNLAELSAYVQDLETALAEAHLMSAPTDGPTSRVGDPV